MKKRCGEKSYSLIEIMEKKANLLFTFNYSKLGGKRGDRWACGSVSSWGARISLRREESEEKNVLCVVGEETRI